MRIPIITTHRFVSILFALLIMPATAHAEQSVMHLVEEASREKTIYFPQFQPVQTVYNEDYMLFRIVGQLTLSDECLRINLGYRSYLLIWPGWYAFDIISHDIVLTHLRTGSVVAQFKLGETLSLSGAELEFRPVGLKYTIPDQCQGPYWAVGEIEPLQLDNKSLKPEKHLKDSKRFSYSISQGHDKTDKEPSKSNKGLNRPVNEHQKPGKTPQKAANDINKPSKQAGDLEDKQIEESIPK